MNKLKTWLSWSSGKDSAYALSILLKDPKYEVMGIFTTVTDNFNRVAMHSVREELLDAQAEKLGLPLYKIRIPYPCPNGTYETEMKKFIEKAKSKDVETFAFGDLFLEDIRSYRIKQLSTTGIEPVFPIWGLDTKDLSSKMIESGFKAVITCIDEKKLDSSFSGRNYNSDFLESLPSSIDPCGENGEFHSFVYNCPMFSKEIEINVGEKISRDGFTFTDVLSAKVQ